MWACRGFSSWVLLSVVEWGETSVTVSGSDGSRACRLVCMLEAQCRGDWSARLWLLSVSVLDTSQGILLSSYWRLAFDYKR